MFPGCYQTEEEKTETARREAAARQLWLDAARWRWFARNMPSAAETPLRLMPPNAVILAESEEG